MNNPEDYRDTPSPLELSGGALVAPGIDGEGLVAFTKYGEFGLDVLEKGIMASFPETGVIFHYGNDHSLKLVSINVSRYINNLTADQVARMPKGGEDLMLFFEWLREMDFSAYVTANLEEHMVKVMMQRGDRLEQVNMDQGINFHNGYLGLLKFGEMKIMVEMRDIGDSFVLGLGEVGEADVEGRGRYGTVNVEASLYVDFDKYIDGTSDFSLNQLAREVLIS